MSRPTAHAWIRSKLQTHAPAHAPARMGFLAAAGLLAVPLPAEAQSNGAPNTPPATTAATPSTPSFDASVSAAIASDYNYRGYTLSDHQPSASTSFEATYGIFFASNDAASVDMPNLSQIQLTDTVGIRPVLASLTVETGVDLGVNRVKVLENILPQELPKELLGTPPEITGQIGKIALERATGIEPVYTAWEADVLPLNYARKTFI
jgi:hypothetical protein